MLLTGIGGNTQLKSVQAQWRREHMEGKLVDTTLRDV